jgi:hypothetical protein
VGGLSFYNNKILDELEEGMEYTEREIARILYFNEGTIVLCSDTSRFNLDSKTTKYKVINKLETYLHECKNRNYHLPNNKRVIYHIKGV